MRMDRRSVLVGGVLAAAGVSAGSRTGAQGAAAMYGLIGKMRVTPGNRDAVVAILLAGTDRMPGCQSYIVAHDPADADAIWITEAWDSEASHAASLKLPAVQEAIGRARPMIAGFGERFVTTPVGGYGLVKG